MKKWSAALAGLFLFFVFTVSGNASPLIIGIDADMSGGSAKAGQSIYRGTLLAVNEINARGGLLGKQLHLEVRDHRGNPARGLANMKEFAAMPNLLAVMGGLHTPVALAELPFIHEHGIIFLIPWAAGTSIVDNDYDPNFVFRVSVRDADAGDFLIGKVQEAGYKKPGLLLEQTGWGRSNEQAMRTAMEEKTMQMAGVRWFHWGAQDMTAQILSLKDAGADVIMLVANAPEGLALVKSMAALPCEKRLPIVSHWGITGGDFANQAGELLHDISLYVLQTFSFSAAPVPKRADHLFALYKKEYPTTTMPEDIPASPGLAHAYDLVHLLAKAAEAAGTSERKAVRDSLETILSHEGIMGTYSPPFTPLRHDALNPDSFITACFNKKGNIVPCQITPAKMQSERCQ
ncbi:amino acid/amide ABC transporter substrate-binding protein (HAAT family) [Desulfobotulus alkaliphilus]|uniref:Amino acid/amide ABC transporter substrate-binding protein (HAAT family) n=1 Tax=Desulfobotulus alkaliphilus TaxID=622671 RepID=A0A562R2W0_9BACT|nr:ABC transporter substrate-binding protein [Desulfobotulus alkaliphilus]TWI63377.1 amino acid/amide ABC transporter substrate-binding protein (HAAT family) [Desulfobotulus alkaliphilus]